MPAPSYIAKDRLGGYLFRIKVPKNLLSAFKGKKVLVKSLRTYHRPTAIVKARKLAVEMQDIFNAITMSEESLRHKLVLAKGRASVTRGYLQNLEESLSADIIKELHQPNSDISSELEAFLAKYSGLEADRDKHATSIKTLQSQLQHIEKRKAEIEAETIAGLALGSPKEHELQFSELLRKVEELQNIVVQRKLTPDSPLISDLWEKYKEEKIVLKEWKKPKMIQERARQIEDFQELIGGDIPASQVDRNTAIRFIEMLSDFPAHRRKKWGTLELHNIPKDAPRISTSTLSQRIDNLIQFFGHLTELQIIERNPFKGLAIDRESLNYATPTTLDLKQWFNLPEKLITYPWHFWIPRIALLCGSRVGEIAQLTPSDIKRDPSTGIHYLLISDEGGKEVKTKAAVRKVPIHQDLIDNGLLTYSELIKAKGLSTLWPKLTLKNDSLGANVSAYWARLRDVHKILSEPVDEIGQRKTFHSLRRVIQNRLNDDAVDLITIQTIVGHEPSLGSSKDYLDEPKPLHVTNAALQRLRIEGIAWEHPKKFKL